MKRCLPLSFIALFVLLLSAACQAQPAPTPASRPSAIVSPATPPAPTLPPSPQPTPTGLSGILAGEGRDGNVYLFNLETAQAALIFEGFSMRAISPDGKLALLEKRTNPEVDDQPPDLDLYAGDLATGAVTLLSSSYYGEAAWVPGTKLAAFIAPEEDREAIEEGKKVNYHLYTVRSDGSGLKMITPPDMGAAVFYSLGEKGFFWSPGTKTLVREMAAFWIPEADGTARKTEKMVSRIVDKDDTTKLYWSGLDGGGAEKADPRTAFGSVPIKYKVWYGPVGSYTVTIQDGKYLNAISSNTPYFDQKMEDFECAEGACRMTFYEQEHPDGLTLSFNMPEEVMAAGQWERIRGPLLSIPGKAVLLTQSVMVGGDKSQAYLYAFSPDGKALAALTPPTGPAFGAEFTPPLCEPFSQPYPCPNVSGQVSADGKSYLASYRWRDGSTFGKWVNGWYSLDLDTYKLKDISSLFSTGMGERLFWTSLR